MKMYVIREGEKIQFVSLPMPEDAAKILQRIMEEGEIVDQAEGERLKDQMLAA